LAAKACIQTGAHSPDQTHSDHCKWQRNNLGIKNARDALEKFERFPQWMWRNDVTLEFVEWLQEHNQKQPK